MSGLTRLGIVFGLTLLLAACGSGDAETPWDLDDETANGTTDGTTDDTTDGTTPVVPEEVFLLGSGSGDTFIEGQLAIGVATLSAGGTSDVAASLADENGNLHQEVETINFSSDCAASGQASIDSPVSTSGGVAITTYEAQGCTGLDTISATATVNGTTLTATGTLTVLPATIGSLQFISAIPTDIGIKGFGLVEVSKVTFKVLDTNGNPVAGEIVNFELNLETGGITLSDTSASSDIGGLVQVDVQSGTVSTVVRVTATLASNPDIKTQSDGLVISTGIADQDSMSVAASVLNPEALNHDGVEVDITVHAADHFNNPVPDGTAVSFTTEGGQIEPQCLTTDGGCSVTWTSANPRPSNGRATILATMIGEEDFFDANGNGVLDNQDTFTDMPEAFRDDNESMLDDTSGLLVDFDQGSEEFLDFNSSGTYDLANGEFNGVLCCDTIAVNEALAGDSCFGVTATATMCGASCCNQERVDAALPGDACYLVTPTTCSTNIHVRGSVVLAMSGSAAFISITSNPINAPTTETVTIVDVNGQLMPNGTLINFTTTNGKIETPTSFTVLNSSVNPLTHPSVAEYGLIISATENNATGDETGLLTIKVTAPDGTITFGTVTVND